MIFAKQGIANLPWLCNSLGMNYIIISPGSRNAPLVAAFANHPHIQAFSITDERCAGFYALGIAQQLQKPVGLLCTSGTALLNFAPAIAEAYYQKIPLVVITADRPPELIDQGDGQTIRQQNLYANYIKKSVSLPVETATISDLKMVSRAVSELFVACTTGNPGPVHLNVPLREPLYNTLPQHDEYAQPIYFDSIVSNESIKLDKHLLETFRGAKNIWIIHGFSAPNEDLKQQLIRLTKDKRITIFAENISNISDECIIYSPERFIASLNEQEKKEFAPQLVITVGNLIVSKRLKTYLQNYKPKEHWEISPSPEMLDTFQVLTHSFAVNPCSFFESLSNSLSNNPCQGSKIHQKELTAETIHRNFLEHAPWSDLAAFSLIINSLPSNLQLHFANSNSIRYSQLFKLPENATCYSNRGVSGIDGSVSTAAGASLVNNKLTLLITGDLGFIYDSNGLWTNSPLKNLRIIIINNGEGNIFRLIDTGEAFKSISNFLTTPHKVELGFLVKAYGAYFDSCSNTIDLNNILKGFFEPSDKLRVLEVKTSATVSADIYKQYFKSFQHD